MILVAYLSSVILGIASWSFAEYAIHNWVGHLGRGRNDFSREHLKHHANGHYFAPARKKLRMAATVTILVAPLGILVAGPLLGSLYAASFVLTYASYEWLHRRCHTHAPRGPYSRWARKHHFHHHFSSPKNNHGVTSPIWDFVFRTHQPPGLVKVPERHAMTWLVDRKTGNVKAEYAADYVITRPKRRHTESRLAA